MKLHYGWVVVAVGALATCVGMGEMFSLPVFLAPISAATGWSRAGIAMAMTLNFVTMGVAAFGWGARHSSHRNLPCSSSFFLACCAAHSGPIFHTVSYTIGCGLPAMTAVTIYSAEGLAGLGGRLLLGVLADRLGTKRVLIAGLIVQALAAGAYAFASRLGEFYAVAVVFGLAYGGVMPLYAVLARAYFAPQIMGTVVGAMVLASSFGMALGPAVGGWIFDTFHSYAWLYIGSLSVGLGAAAIALAFPPVRASAPCVMAGAA